MPLTAQVRGPLGAVAHDRKAAAAGPRGVAVKGEEGYAAAGRRGAVATGEEGYAAVGRRGAVAATDDSYARVGPRGAVVAGEEGVAAVGRRGVVVGDRYESYDAWKVAAGVGAGWIGRCSRNRRPRRPWRSAGPRYYADGVLHAGHVGDAVEISCSPPVGIVNDAASGCTSVKVSGVAYSQCGPTYY